jgi:transposase
MPELLGDVHHRSLDDQADVAVLRARDLCVRMRTKCVQHVRGTLKAFGLRARSCSAKTFHQAAREAVPQDLEPALGPILDQLAELELRIRHFDRQIEQVAHLRYPEAARLRQVCGVGALTSLAFVLTVDDPTRFEKSRTVGSWVGLCPRVLASGDQDPQLSISKTGSSYLRRLLVQSAQYVLGPFGKDSDLRRYGLRLCERGGKAARRRAVVAVARRLAVLLHRLWVSGVPYDALRNTERAPVTA